MYYQDAKSTSLPQCLQVGVVAFSDTPQTPPGTASTSTCYSDRLAMATPTNKQYLIKTFLQVGLFHILPYMINLIIRSKG